MSQIQTIGIDLGGTNVRVGLVENGIVIKHASAKIPKPETNPQIIINCIIDTVNQVYSPEIIGIGLGLPGTMDKKEGIIRAITNIPSFTNIPIKQILSSKYNVPVFIDNDVNCFILGEKFYGAGQEYRNVVGLSLGTGMGSGIINANKLIEDANSGSGEFGEVPYLDANFEAYCSGQFFKKAMNKTGEEVYKMAAQNNAKALETFAQFGMHLGKAIHIILLALDPQAIIIGGSASKSKEFFHASMINEVEKFVYQDSVKKLTIKYAQERYSPILGASKLVELNN